ncbi:hypothetical protein AYO20_04734 [Fonsecaea nubica]|uniref:Uncharacterized protein n=1 Tax=Fonsecaea nubica TaxID=856822 RepID=A0A178D3F7_9EURO|nr:hypothetical protein AYO20_04734 [Fonsecaea nubica]OAL36072.1 hypothetical protein AYO20_04734 [Fonsecaea nubica]
MATDHIVWMMVFEPRGLYDWWSASSQRSKSSVINAKQEDFPPNAKDFSGASVFASETWIEGQRIVVPESTARLISVHIVDNPALVKTCIPLPVEEGVLRPTCPVIQRQPRLEVSTIVGKSEVTPPSQPFVGGRLGIIAVLGVLAIILCFLNIIYHRIRGSRDLEVTQHEKIKDLDLQIRNLSNKVQEQAASIVDMNETVASCHERNDGLNNELQRCIIKMKDDSESMKGKDDLAHQQQAMLEEQDSLIKKQEATMAEQESRSKEHQDALVRLSEMQETLQQKENEIKEKESAIAQLMEEKEAALEEASVLGGVRDRLTGQLDQANTELRSATCSDKDLSRRREEMLTKQNKKLHTYTLHIKGLKAQIEGLGQVPVPAPVDAAAPYPTIEEAGAASPTSASASSVPAARCQSTIESRWAEAAPPSQPAAFRGGWQGRGRGRGRGGRRS